MTEPTPLTLFMLPGSPRVESASPFCVKVARALNLKGLPWRAVYAGRRLKTLENPSGKLPVLQHGPDLLSDSAAILTFLDRLQPEPPLTPRDPADAARARVLESWASLAFYPDLLYLRWVIDANYARYKAAFIDPWPREQRLLTRRRVLRDLRSHGVGLRDLPQVLSELRRRLDDLDALLRDAPFLLGEAPSRADLALFAVTGALVLGTTPEAEPLVRERPALWAWLQRTDARTRRPA